MKSFMHGTANDQTKNVTSAILMAVVIAGTLIAPEFAMAQGFDDAEAQSKVEGFFGSLNSLLNIASIAVVTIAVIFAGYQIAFAHKRISDVAPVLIGGFLIGAAAQIAKMLLGSDSTLDEGTVMLMNAIPMFHA